jgi:MFS-type transporter involved in bile tolerance (Atg22 family)
MAWYAYDLGNTAVEFAIPLYLTLWIVSDLGVPAWVYGVVSAVSSWAIGLTGPYIGVSADVRHRRRQWFVFSALCSAILLMSLAFLPTSGTAALAAMLAVAALANYLFQLASLVYNASLIGAAAGTNVVSVSSIGMAFSYLGGFLGIGIIELVTSGRLIPGVSGRGAAVVPAALIFLVCALPGMVAPRLWQMRPHGSKGGGESLHKHVTDIWHEASRERRAGWFLGGFFALNSAVMGLTLYLPLHIETVTDLEGGHLLALYASVVIASALGAGTVAWLRPTGRTVRLVIIMGLVLLAVNTFVFAVARSLPLMVLCACLHGLFSGAIVPACRGAFAQIFHADHQALAFGLYGAVQRLSQGLGAVLWPLAGAGAGSYATRWGVGAMGILALLGVPLFWRWRFAGPPSRTVVGTIAGVSPGEQPQ